ncbi:MAG: hypothetical protein HLUCCO17_12000 [Saliniramus fredricksonii]|uniref:Uncharacterized protein n=1 Tax=Saliniramus fredricksonii TaxID=1653334 RepID=A0A0P7Y1F6_9HYPH|nr:hypothetical protein [Saliniramus fredricksonii]KPQ10159.1 MAG: hypothetical protein HLUCCO17_12000 [Saliniramus fredricksonii]SCC79212.1 hypothetical protein GA0071312_0745 [Saliniramus fredricksonii]
MTQDKRNWVSEVERDRFSDEERRRADDLFRAIGIDPDVYRSFARAQVERTHAAFETDNNHSRNAEDGTQASSQSSSH